MDLEPRGKRCRCRGRHRLRHGERADTLRAVVLERDVGGFDQRAGGRTARTHNDTGTLVFGIIFFFQAAVCQRLLHRNVVPGAALGKEAHGAAVDEIRRVDIRLSPDLALETVLGEIGRKGDAGFRSPQGFGDFACVVTDRGHDTEARDNYPSHLL
ncbi:hypothetical protein D3C73_490050 [compost metagenome]